MDAAVTTEKEQLERQARAVNQKLHAIRDAERYAENEALVGKTFRYRNNYSCPEKPSDYWWLYARVQGIDSSGYLTVFCFETDKYGAVKISTDKYRFHMNDGYQPVSVAKFNKAWRDLQRKIAKTRP